MGKARQGKARQGQQSTIIIMVVYSFYIFDRHTECIYSRLWARQPDHPLSSSGGRPISTSSTTSNTTTLVPQSQNSTTTVTDPNLGPARAANTSLSTRRCKAHLRHDLLAAEH